MTTLSSPRRWVSAATQRVTSSRVGSRVMIHIAHRADALTLRLTRGRYSMTSVLTDQPFITLTTTGAKSGEPRSVPLLGIPDGDNIILIASSWGQTKHPSWYYNLRAHPQAIISRDGHSRSYLAEELAGEERERCWDMAVRVYPGYNAYRRWTNGRSIPVMRLTPQQASSA
ncbi:MAG: nitroreductase family deazaflavin-dependent oxidoreductase [Anaerolineae bacterium]